MSLLLDLIEQGACEQALALLRGDNYFSEDELNNCLMSACHHKHIFIVQMLVQQGANVNYQDTNGNTPLLISVQRDVTDIVQFLLTNRADVNACNAVGDSALILSLCSLSMEITESLLKQTGINIAHQNQDGYTAIMKAAEVKDVDTLKIFLDKYFNVGCVSTSYYELINEHKTQEHISTLREVVNCKGENVHQIAERCGIGSVFQLLRECRITAISPLDLAMGENDIQSFYTFLDSDFLHATERKKYLNYLFLKIFLTHSTFGTIDFNKHKIAMMKAVLEHGVDVNATWLDHIPLFDREIARCCSFEGRPSQFVLMQRSYCYKRNKDPIQIAAKIGRLKVVQLLLSFKADINRYKFSSSPLHIALIHGHIKCAKLFIQHGANIDFNQVLQLAVDQQQPIYSGFLIMSYKNEIIQNLKETSKIEDIFLRAIRMGNLKIIGQILDLGADINGVKGSAMCPLAESQTGEVARFLVYRGADVNDRCGNGKTPLMLAAVKEGSMSVMQLLLDHGAELCARDGEGNTALILAVRAGCVKNVSFLLQCSKELLNVQNDEGLTALMCAMRSWKLAIMKKLIHHGADVRMEDSDGNTCLLHLLFKSTGKEGKMLKHLIQAGCDVNCQNNNGLSPLMVATKYHLKKSMCVLLNSGAEIDAVSKTDNTVTALTHLSPGLDNYFDCLEYLLDRGASSSYLGASAVHNMIVTGKLHLVPKLIRCGLGPADVLVSDVLSSNEAYNTNAFGIRSLTYLAKITSHYSPLCTSLVAGNSELARFFVENLFLTTSDVFLLGHNKLMRSRLAIKNHKECIDILTEITAQPMSLFNLSFVAVSTSVGATPGREIRVNKLPVPQIIKDKLLFKG